MSNKGTNLEAIALSLVERFSAPNPTESAHFHYFYHVPSACQPVTHQRGRIWVARLVLLILGLIVVILALEFLDHPGKMAELVRQIYHALGQSHLHQESRRFY